MAELRAQEDRKRSDLQRGAVAVGGGRHVGMGRQESKQSFGTASREVRDASVDRRGGSSGQGRTQEQEPKMRRVRERGLEWRDGRRQSKKPTDKLLAPNRSCRSDRQLAEDGTQG